MFNPPDFTFPEMQLASNGDKEECSESEPILNQQASGDSSFSCEIIAAGGDFAPAANHDLQNNVPVDETCHLVNVDQPQCRICLDIGGL